MDQGPSSTLNSALSKSLVAQYRRPLPDVVRAEAERSLLNVLATSIGASDQEAVEIVIGLAGEVGGPGLAPIPGRTERADLHHAALATGVAAHLDDFDDTHLATVIHPGAASLAGGLPVAFWKQSSGHDLLLAFALGVEVQLRIGQAMSPTHYDEGWHITGTVGAIGAAVTAGLLIGLDAEGLEAAISIAAAHPLGHREAFGTMEKSFHPGRSAAWGITSTLLADAGCPGARGVFEQPGGYFELLSAASRPGAVLQEWGARWEILSNTYKPYPCGIVCHPAIDAAVALAGRIADVASISSATLHCNPLVAELTGNPAPVDGLEARFSTIHAVAAGLADGRVGLPQYTDERVAAKDLLRLRSVIALAADGEMPRDAARLEVRLADGNHLEETVAHARGSLQRPLTGAELAEKAEGLIEPILPGRTELVLQAVRDLDGAPGVDSLVAAVTAGGTR